MSKPLDVDEVARNRAEKQERTFQKALKKIAPLHLKNLAYTMLERGMPVTKATMLANLDSGMVIPSMPEVLAPARALLESFPETAQAPSEQPDT